MPRSRASTRLRSQPLEIFGHDAHALSRARERYGLDLCPSDLRHVIESVHRGDGEFICYQGQTRYLHEVVVQGSRCVVVYDPTEHRIRTFLPAIGDRSIPEYLEDLAKHFQWGDE